MKKKILPLQDTDILRNVFGRLNENVDYLEESFQVQISQVKEGICIQSESLHRIEKASVLLMRLIALARKGTQLDLALCRYLSTEFQQGNTRLEESFATEVVTLNAKGQKILCKTLGQKDYVDTIRKNTITFVNGPAGTGKTYLAVALAVQAFRQGEVDRIILTRPAVEAGEKLGFLPGDLQMKVDPYMRPLYDALYDFLGTEKYTLLMERGNIEISPLAYMRGRTLDKAFIILDEAQNTTREQMKMFLTRIGFQSKVVITGDATQTDLPEKQKSGLLEAPKILSDIQGLAFVTLKGKDVVRSPIVQKVIEAYEVYEKKFTNASDNLKKEQEGKNEKS